MSSQDIYNWQYNSNPIYVPDRNNTNILVVIAKPTRVCNADCSYCSSPPLEEMGSNWEPEWNFETFKNYFDKVFPYMGNGAYWIWHGGEPMLMGTEFYLKTYEYAREQMRIHKKLINFSMQSNMLGYNKKWKHVFETVFFGSISTSFDPDEFNRTIKGNPATYSKVFKRVLNEILDDGFRPLVIGVYDEKTAPLMNKMYEWSRSLGDKSFPLRFNYCQPSGRFLETGEAIKPETYAKYLIEIYDQWISDSPDFVITPLDQMFKKVIGIDIEGHCPWTRKCGGKFIEIEPDGDIYNCSEFADYSKKYCFGNLKEKSLPELLNSKPAKQIKRRVTQLPVSCQNCEHFDDCEGGCARDSALYNNGLYGKFHYCQTWKMVFSRIKESILLGQADNIVEKYGQNPEKIKQLVKTNLNNHFHDFTMDWDSIQDSGLNGVFGFGNNLIESKDNKYSIKGEFLPHHEDEIIYFEDKNSSINQKLQNINIKIIN